MLLIFLVLRATYSFDAGWISARIAKGSQKPIPFLAGLLLLTGVVVQALNWSFYPAWYHIGFLVPIIPCALLGVMLGESKRQSEGSHAPRGRRRYRSAQRPWNFGRLFSMKAVRPSM